MPDRSVNLMWIGNRSQLDSTPLTNIEETEAGAIVKWVAEGKAQIKPVEVTGNSYTNTAGPAFRASYQGEINTAAGSTYEAPSRFTYADPVTGAPVQNVQMTAFLAARYQVTYHDADGTAHVIVRSGILVQMSNGDLFFRPSLQNVPEWDGIDRISKVEIDSAAPQPWNDPERANIYPSAEVGFKASIFELEVVCFARGTLIECATGLRAVEDLRVGDLVWTVDNGFQPIRWIGSQQLDVELAANPRLRPIRIRAGALGKDVPARDLVVSPQHRILVRSKIAMRLFGAAEVLVAAKQLLAVDGVGIADDLAQVEYVHFTCDQHEIVLANGTEAETLYLGAQALRALGNAARVELLAIFPELDGAMAEPEPAREIVAGRDARKLAARHHQHGRPVVSPAAEMA